MSASTPSATPVCLNCDSIEDSRIVAAVVKVEFDEIPRRMPSDADLAQLGRRVVRSAMDDRHGSALRRLQLLLRDTAR
jgi:hypothetical protein